MYWLDKRINSYIWTFVILSSLRQKKIWIFYDECNPNECNSSETCFWMTFTRLRNEYKRHLIYFWIFLKRIEIYFRNANVTLNTVSQKSPIHNGRYNEFFIQLSQTFIQYVILGPNWKGAYGIAQQVFVARSGIQSVQRTTFFLFLLFNGREIGKGKESVTTFIFISARRVEDNSVYKRQNSGRLLCV